MRPVSQGELGQLDMRLLLAIGSIFFAVVGGAMHTEHRFTVLEGGLADVEELAVEIREEQKGRTQWVAKIESLIVRSEKMQREIAETQERLSMLMVIVPRSDVRVGKER